ncbi:HNH endonuclease [Polaromonas sp.]|uniref:HNH endonuclease n=1 Tax=Polaromonas sp. TaxID=1869339 RepID=UPI0027308068|nr:HNH endonuclease [Polaromonas sp.]MDP1742256.1 HNH endonuclease [Polaromonas sp.]
MAVSFADIHVGSHWSRPALASLWGYRAYQALARGVVTPAGDNKIILFVTEEKQLSATSYKDVLNEDVLQWEGPNDHFAEERMLAAKSRGETIHLFHRPRHHMEFEYRGELAILSVKLKTNRPSQFVFEVLDEHRQSWTHDQLLAAFYLYLQLKPSELRGASTAISEFADQLGKPRQAVSAKLRALTQLDPLLANQPVKASDNVTPLDKSVWSEFEDDWTKTTLIASEAYEDVVGTYQDAAEASQPSAADASYLFQEGLTREALVKVRKNQYVFRKAILNSYNTTCCISGLRNEKLLIASHIVPWTHDIANRLNPANGLCLSALHDRAYDQGLFTVLPNYSIRISTKLSQEKGNSFLSEALLRHDGKEINLPGRFHPGPDFLRAHATRFGYITR